MYLLTSFELGKLQSVVVSDFPCSGGDQNTLGVHKCPAHSQCMHWGEGPNYGLTSFEDFRKGLLTVFQLITLEGWTAVFYLVSVSGATVQCANVRSGLYYVVWYNMYKCWCVMKSVCIYVWCYE